MTKPVKIAKARGRPMLSWVGKHPVTAAEPFPAQKADQVVVSGDLVNSHSWEGWPGAFSHGGLVFEGDNKDVLIHLIAAGFRGKIDLIYIDPPFDSGANYV